MLRGSLLAAALITLLSIGSGTEHVRNGRIAYAHLGDGKGFQIYSMTADGRRRHPLTTGHRYSGYFPAYAPRGKRIAFVRGKDAPDIWTMNADGTHKRALTAGKSLAGSIEPAWSPDGKWIAFAVVGWPMGIWLVRADGTGTPVQLTSEEDRNPAWSPDGSEIAFNRDQASPDDGEILVVPASGGTPMTLSSDPGVYSDLEPAWSPDGTKILFVSDRPDSDQTDGFQLDLWVMNADGSDVRRVTNTPKRDESDPAWSPDGRRIVYSGVGAASASRPDSAIGIVSSHGGSQIYVSNGDGSNRHKLTHACTLAECAQITDHPTWRPLR